MALMTRTKKTANTTGYVVALPSGGCSKLVVGSETGEIWVKPVVGATSTPSTPTSAAIPASAGDETDYAHIVDGDGREFNLADGYSADNSGLRFTHLLVWSVVAGYVEILGA